jgi:acyl-CoA synthetase (NDP forming)
MSFNYCCAVERRHQQEEIPTFNVDQGSVQDILKGAVSEDRDLLLSEALEMLEIYGISTATSLIAKTEAEAQESAEQIGYPVAIKIIAEQISHKSDVGGVQLNLRNRAAVGAAFEDMMARIQHAYPEAKIDGVLIQPMITGGRELILGGRQDPHFGPVVMVGLGGIFVEIFKESNIRVAPISRREAKAMLESLRGYSILTGARGIKPADIDAVVDAILRVSQLLVDYPKIQELDINPLRVFHEGEGCVALDARIIV